VKYKTLPSRHIRRVIAVITAVINGTVVFVIVKSPSNRRHFCYEIECLNLRSCMFSKVFKLLQRYFFKYRLSSLFCYFLLSWRRYQNSTEMSIQFLSRQKDKFIFFLGCNTHWGFPKVSSSTSIEVKIFFIIIISSSSSLCCQGHWLVKIRDK